MYPKQLLPLAGEQTMLQATALRVRGLEEGYRLRNRRDLGLRGSSRTPCSRSYERI
jgi:hypothetical protein